MMGTRWRAGVWTTVCVIFASLLPLRAQAQQGGLQPYAEGGLSMGSDGMVLVGAGVDLHEADDWRISASGTGFLYRGGGELSAGIEVKSAPLAFGRAYVLGGPRVYMRDGATLGASGGVGMWLDSPAQGYALEGVIHGGRDVAQLSVAVRRYWR